MTTKFRYLFLDVETTGLNAFLDRIVCISFCRMHPDGSTEPITQIAPTIDTKDDEFSLIRQFLVHHIHLTLPYVDNMSENVIVTYNGDAFDLRFLITRAYKYGLNPTLLLYYKHIDLVWIMRKYFKTDMRTAISLQDFARFLGIPVTDTITGADIPFLWEQNKFDEIKKHCESDVNLLMKIHEKLYDLCLYDIKQRYKEGA